MSSSRRNKSTKSLDAELVAHDGSVEIDESSIIDESLASAHAKIIVPKEKAVSQPRQKSSSLGFFDLQEVSLNRVWTSLQEVEHFKTIYLALYEAQVSKTKNLLYFESIKSLSSIAYLESLKNYISIHKESRVAFAYELNLSYQASPDIQSLFEKIYAWSLNKSVNRIPTARTKVHDFQVIHSHIHLKPQDDTRQAKIFKRLMAIDSPFRATVEEKIRSHFIKGFK